jgi:hypothetical protein
VAKVCGQLRLPEAAALLPPWSALRERSGKD